jgi:tRNA U55 pseudouridine synthase TruB
MENVLKLYKNVGETPLECLERFRVENSEYKDVPMTYAGRLDPMAEGVLIVLAVRRYLNV